MLLFDLLDEKSPFEDDETRELLLKTAAIGSEAVMDLIVGDLLRDLLLSYECKSIVMSRESRFMTCLSANMPSVH